jgi:hypothetical protein
MNWLTCKFNRILNVLIYCKCNLDEHGAHLPAVQSSRLPSMWQTKDNEYTAALFANNAHSSVRSLEADASLLAAASFFLSSSISGAVRKRPPGPRGLRIA